MCRKHFHVLGFPRGAPSARFVFPSARVACFGDAYMFTPGTLNPLGRRACRRRRCRGRRDSVKFCTQTYLRERVPPWAGVPVGGDDAGRVHEVHVLQEGGGDDRRLGVRAGGRACDVDETADTEKRNEGRVGPRAREKKGRKREKKKRVRERQKKNRRLREQHKNNRENGQRNVGGAKNPKQVGTTERNKTKLKHQKFRVALRSETTLAFTLQPPPRLQRQRQGKKLHPPPTGTCKGLVYIPTPTSQPT